MTRAELHSPDVPSARQLNTGSLGCQWQESVFRSLEWGCLINWQVKWGFFRSCNSSGELWRSGLRAILSIYSVKKFFDTFFPPTLKRYFLISLCSLNQHVLLVNIFKVRGFIKVFKPNHFHTAKFWFVTIVKYLKTQPFGLVLNSNICLFIVYFLLTPSESDKILSRSKNDCVSINNCVFRLNITFLCILQRLLKSPG